MVATIDENNAREGENKKPMPVVPSPEGSDLVNRKFYLCNANIIK